MSLIPALATSRAAPNMMRPRHTTDIGDLRELLVGFTRWNHVRAAGQILAFAANLWALASLLLNR